MAVSRGVKHWLDALKSFGYHRPDVAIILLAWVLFVLYHTVNYASLVSGDGN